MLSLKNLFAGSSFTSVKPQFLFILFMLFLLGSFFSSLIPPFQSPDEQDHLKRAYFLSKGRIAMVTPSGQSTGGLIDTGLHSYIASFHYITGNQFKKLTAGVQQKAELIRWSGEETFGPCPGVNYYFPFIYLPQALGLTIGQVLDLTVSQSYYLARYMALLSSLLVILFAFAIHRPSPFVVSLLLTPLMLFQFVATSQDGFAIALVVLAGSLFLRITVTKHQFNSAHFFGLCVSILLLTTSRVNLLPMLILPFVAIYISTKAVKYYVVSIATVSLSLAWVFYALATTVDNRIETGASTSEIAAYYLKDPFAFIAVLKNTLQDSETMHFYIGSFVGILGWLETSIGEVHIKIICLLLLVVFLSTISVKSLKTEYLPRATLFFVASASIILTFFLLLVTWNKHPAEIIRGVQGRYFWASIILLGFSLTVGVNNLFGLRKWIATSSLLCIVLISILVTPKVLLARYFLGSAQTTSSTILKERSITIVPKSIDMNAERGGFIDSSEYKNGEIMVAGWGYFDQDEKLFLTNKEQPIVATYLTIERPDVAGAMSEEKFIYAGFEIRIDAETEQEAKTIMDGLCFYSYQPSYGTKEIISGGGNKLYKCGMNQ